jgi:hypothetical protein
MQSIVFDLFSMLENIRPDEKTDAAYNDEYHQYSLHINIILK